MPELPELRHAARVVNKHGGKLFVSYRKSEISRNEVLQIPFPRFHLSAKARGKELMVTFTPALALSESLGRIGNPSTLTPTKPATVTANGMLASSAAASAGNAGAGKGDHASTADASLSAGGAGAPRSHLKRKLSASAPSVEHQRAPAPVPAPAAASSASTSSTSSSSSGVADADAEAEAEAGCESGMSAAKAKRSRARKSAGAPSASRSVSVALPPSAPAASAPSAHAPASSSTPPFALYILFNFGMSGQFVYFAPGEKLHKHAHFVFIAEDGSSLAFVDQRRFGRWAVVPSPASWGAERGPDPVDDFEAFARNVALWFNSGARAASEEESGSEGEDGEDKDEGEDGDEDEDMQAVETKEGHANDQNPKVKKRGSAVSASVKAGAKSKGVRKSAASDSSSSPSSDAGSGASASSSSTSTSTSTSGLNLALWRKKPICQLLLEQSLFNGIGNYLRSEICHDAGLDPFARVSSALAGLTVDNCARHPLLRMCREVPLRFCNLQTYFAYGVQESEEHHAEFHGTLKVYGKKKVAGVTSKKDSAGRTVWLEPKTQKLTTFKRF